MTIESFRAHGIDARRSVSRPTRPAGCPGVRALVLACALPMAAVVPACTTVPGSDRSQFNVMPLSVEMSLGLQAYSQTLGEEKVVKSGADYEMVKRVGERIATSAKRMYPDPSR
jgi:hypothetical protein